MIKWECGRVTVIECDICDETIEAEKNERWDVFWPRAKSEGWKASRGRGIDNWTHSCPIHEA